MKQGGDYAETKSENTPTRHCAIGCLGAKNLPAIINGENHSSGDFPIGGGLFGNSQLSNEPPQAFRRSKCGPKYIAKHRLRQGNGDQIRPVQNGRSHPACPNCCEKLEVEFFFFEEKFSECYSFLMSWETDQMS